MSYEDKGVANGEYTVVVRATDPSGETTDNENRDDIVVKVVATDVNEAPKVKGPGLAELSVYEADSSNKNYYVGLGDEVVVRAASSGTRQPLTCTTVRKRTLLIRPAGLSQLLARTVRSSSTASPPMPAGIGRRLHFKSAPDFENPLDANRDNVYEVTVTVVDTAGSHGYEERQDHGHERQ